jgi:hypothetical protein
MKNRITVFNLKDYFLFFSEKRLELFCEPPNAEKNEKKEIIFTT